MSAFDAFSNALLGKAMGNSGTRDTLTDDPALDSFARNVAENSLYYELGAPIAATRFDTRTWSPETTAGVNLGQAFLSGLLGRLGSRDVAQQLKSTSAILPELYRNPSAAIMPEGVDPQSFETLRASALRENAVQEKKLQQSVIADLLTRQPEFAAIAPGLAKTAGISELGAALARPRVPLSPQVAAAAKRSGLLDEGREPTIEKIKRITMELTDSGMPKAQAAVTAREMVEGEVKANRSSFDSAKQAREAAANIRNVADTAEAGLSQLGETGNFVGVGKAKDLLMSSVFGDEEAKRRRAGRSMLESIAPDVIKMSKSAGSGAMSDVEMRSYLGAGPSEDKSTEANYALIAKMKNVARLNEDYADFIEAYRDENDGSIVKADQKWAEYKREFPAFKKVGNEMVLNNDRPPWQDYFAAKADPEAYKRLKESEGVVGGDVPRVGGTFNGKKVLGVRRIK